MRAAWKYENKRPYFIIHYLIQSLEKRGAAFAGDAEKYPTQPPDRISTHWRPIT